jgi:Bacterial Ig-like domain (group 3)
MVPMKRSRSFACGVVPLLCLLASIVTALLVAAFGTGIGAAWGPMAIAVGLDASSWFTEVYADLTGRTAPAGTVTEFTNGNAARSVPEGIADGHDGRVWFAEFTGPRVARTTTTGGGSPAPTMTSAMSSLDPSSTRRSAPFTADVTGSCPPWTIQFEDGRTNIGGRVASSGGSAACPTSALMQGTHSFAAVYSGDANAGWPGSGRKSRC